MFGQKKKLIHFNDPNKNPFYYYQRYDLTNFLEYKTYPLFIDEYINSKTSLGIKTLSPLLDFMLIRKLSLKDCVFSNQKEDIKTLFDNFIFYDALYVFSDPNFYLGTKKVNPSLIYDYLTFNGIGKAIESKSFEIVGFIMMNAYSFCPYISFFQHLAPLFGSENNIDKLILETILLSQYTIKCMGKNTDAKIKILLYLLLNFDSYKDILLSIPWNLDYPDLQIIRQKYREIYELLHSFANYVISDPNTTQIDVSFMIDNLLFFPSIEHMIYAFKENKPYYKLMLDNYYYVDGDLSKHIEEENEDAINFIINQKKYRPTKKDFIMLDSISNQNIIENLSQYYKTSNIVDNGQYGNKSTKIIYKV